MEGGEKKEGEEVRNSRVEVQLREALCANTEITDENERLRQEKDDLEKEISVCLPLPLYPSLPFYLSLSQMRQSCIDEMIQQTSVLQASQQSTAQTVQSLRKEVRENKIYTRCSLVDCILNGDNVLFLADIG